MSVQVSYKKQTLLGLFLIFVILLSVEFASYAYELFNSPCSFPNKDAFDKTSIFLTYQMCLDHNKIVNFVDTILLFEPNQHYSTININSHGMRGPEISLEKPADTYRIFLVGGSTAFGTASTSDQTTISGFLQKEFDNLKINYSVEVINAGIGGADSAREVYYIKKILSQFDPDMYIIYDGYNDAVRELEYGEFGDERFDVLGSAKSRDNIFKFSNYPDYRTPFVMQKILFGSYDPWDVDRYVDPDDIDEKTMLWKDRWNEFCKTSEDTIVIAVHPILGGSAKELSTDESRMLSESNYHKTIIKTIDSMANELTVLDKTCDKTLDLRFALDDISEPVHYDLVHVNDLGNKAISEKIFHEIYPLLTE